jgi:hypothetical protein
MCEAGRCLQPKGAKVVTGARQTGVKDFTFSASADDSGAGNWPAVRSGNINIVSRPF